MSVITVCFKQRLFNYEDSIELKFTTNLMHNFLFIQ
jgi:hypothetical protein